uniref:Uncharacterized protein n=1 Tax=Ditylenchus dipsaci TaxID=166011 RepID=A0A915EBW7_9BILA
MKGPIAGAVIANVGNGDSGTASKTDLPMLKRQRCRNVPVDLLVNPIANVQSALEKKLRNLGKRTQKLQQIKLDRANGIKLTEEQLDAISKAGEVELQVEFIKDLQKLATQQVRQYQRAARQKDDALTKKTQENNLNL